MLASKAAGLLIFIGRRKALVSVPQSGALTGLVLFSRVRL